MRQWKVIYYYSKEDKSPPLDFINSLDEKAQSKIIKALFLLRDFGIKLGRPHIKKLAGTPLWELRVIGQDNVRLLYVAEYQQTFLILHGFVKKKQKTPKKEIKTALSRLNEYRSVNKD